MYDIVIIGVGVSGATSTRELSWYKVDTYVLERGGDVCRDTSKANSAVVHVGYDVAEDSPMTRLNVERNQIMPELTKELDFPFSPYGSFVACLDEGSLPGLRAPYERGAKNGIKDLEIITGKARIKEMESNLTDGAVGVLYALTASIVCPFNLNITLAEDVYTSGMGFKFNTEVTDIHRIEDGWALEINQGVYETRRVANAVGVHIDKFHNMVNGTRVHITPRKEDYCLLDRNAGNHVSYTIFTLPGKYGEGILVPPTAHGNLIVGPTAINIEDKKATATTREGLDGLIAKAGMNVKDLPMCQVIISFAGLRAHEDHHEFIIRELEDVPGFVDYVRIESPGLTSCPAIGRMVTGILKEKLGLEPNPQSDGSRKGVLDPGTLTKEKQAELIRQNPAYGNIICRYEVITEGEILNAIYRPLGTRSLGGIKRRTRAGMDRYQIGFYVPRSMELLHRGLGLPMTEITKTDGGSKFVVGTNKDRIQKGMRAR